MESSHPCLTSKSSKRILVLGGTGLVGSAVVYQLLRVGRFEVHATSRLGIEQYTAGVVPHGLNLGSGELSAEMLLTLLNSVKPDYVVNCLRSSSGTVEAEYFINAAVPLLLETEGCRVIQISTNALFRSRARSWDLAEGIHPSTPYELSKALGERPSQVCIRTSVIGVPFYHPTASGYINQLYKPAYGPWNGVTNLALAKTVVECIQQLAQQSWQPIVLHLHSRSMQWSAIRKVFLREFGAQPGFSTQPYAPKLLAGDLYPQSLTEQLRQLKVAHEYPEAVPTCL